MITSTRSRKNRSWSILRAAALATPAVLALAGTAGATVLYWDPDGIAGNNVVGTGAGTGGSGTYQPGVTAFWWDGVSGSDQSFNSTGNGNGAYVSFIAFYAVCVLVTWAVYLRSSDRTTADV